MALFEIAAWIAGEVLFWVALLLFWIIVFPIICIITTPFILILAAFNKDGYWTNVRKKYRKIADIWSDISVQLIPV